MQENSSRIFINLSSTWRNFVLWSLFRRFFVFNIEKLYLVSEITSTQFRFKYSKLPFLVLRYVNTSTLSKYNGIEFSINVEQFLIKLQFCNIKYRWTQSFTLRSRKHFQITHVQTVYTHSYALFYYYCVSIACTHISSVYGVLLLKEK